MQCNLVWCSMAFDFPWIGLDWIVQKSSQISVLTLLMFVNVDANTNANYIKIKVHGKSNFIFHFMPFNVSFLIKPFHSIPFQSNPIQTNLTHSLILSPIIQNLIPILISATISIYSFTKPPNIWHPSNC